MPPVPSNAILKPASLPAPRRHARANRARNLGSGLIDQLCFAVGLAALPLAIGVAILRYRLGEIDRLVGRTVSYALLTGALIGIFIGLVALTADTLAIGGDRCGVHRATARRRRDRRDPRADLIATVNHAVQPEHASVRIEQ
jgi:hypothetical protein